MFSTYTVQNLQLTCKYVNHLHCFVPFEGMPCPNAITKRLEIISVGQRVESPLCNYISQIVSELSLSRRNKVKFIYLSDPRAIISLKVFGSI